MRDHGCPIVQTNVCTSESTAHAPSLMLQVAGRASLPERLEHPTCGQQFTPSTTRRRLRACANRLWATVGSAIPTVVDPCFSDEPTHYYDHLGEGNPEVDDPPPALGAPRQILMGVVPGVGAFNHPTFRCS